MYALDKKKEELELDEDDEVGRHLHLWPKPWTLEIVFKSVSFFLLQEYDASEYPQRVGRLKHVLDIEVVFGDNRRGGRGRGRGMGRGMGRGRGMGGVGGPIGEGGPRGSPREFGDSTSVSI